MTDYSRGGALARHGEGFNWIASGANADTGTTLNSAQVFGASGGGVAYRFSALRASSIKKIYLFCNAVTGTAGNLAVQGEIRAERTSGTNFQSWPGTTVLQAAVTGSWATKGAKHWVEFDFSSVPYTPAIGETLWLNIFNTAAAPATDYPQFITTTGMIAGGTPFYPAQGHTTTGGYSAAATANSTAPAVCVIEYADGTIDGNPYTRSISFFFTANQLERGAVYDGWDVPKYCYGIAWSVGGVSWANLNIYAGNTAPGGSMYQSFALGATSGQTIDRSVGLKVFSPVLLQAGTKYRVVLKPNSPIQVPTVAQIEGAADFADLMLAGNGGNTIGYSTVDNGAGGWTDDKSAWPQIQLMIASDVSGLPRSREFLGVMA